MRTAPRRTDATWAQVFALTRDDDDAFNDAHPRANALVRATGANDEDMTLVCAFVRRLTTVRRHARRTIALELARSRVTNEAPTSPPRAEIRHLDARIRSHAIARGGVHAMVHALTPCASSTASTAAAAARGRGAGRAREMASVGAKYSSSACRGVFAGDARGRDGGGWCVRARRGDCIAREASAVRSPAEVINFEGLQLEMDDSGAERVKLQVEGWKRWTWRGYECNYISAGENNDGPIVTLVHGFGAHSYHWRYTIPALARAGYRVYALCMLGYGWSPKVEEEYSMELWGQQVIDFSREVAGATAEDKTFIAGNSIGALAALYAASTAPDSCKGLILVNSAGNFEPDAAPGPEKKTLAQQAVGNAEDQGGDTIMDKLREAFGRVTATGIFYFTKVRIKTILQQVYEFDVDDDLVKSIDLAAQDPGAIGTFYQLSLAGSRTKIKPSDLLRDWTGPLMLLWGEKDPWMTPTKAQRILEIKPNAKYVPVLGGHCPHDDCPTASSDAMKAFFADVGA